MKTKREEITIRVKEGYKNELLALLYYGKVIYSSINETKPWWEDQINLSCQERRDEYKNFFQKIFAAIEIEPDVVRKISNDFSEDDYNNEVQLFTNFLNRPERPIKKIQAKLLSVNTHNEQNNYFINIIAHNILACKPTPVSVQDDFQKAVIGIRESNTSKLESLYPTELKYQIKGFDWLVGTRHPKEFESELKSAKINKGAEPRIMEYFYTMMLDDDQPFLDKSDVYLIIGYVFSRYDLLYKEQDYNKSSKGSESWVSYLKRT